MKRTYERTQFIEDLTKATFRLYVFNESKYTANIISDKIEVEYTGVKEWSVIEGGKEAEAIESIVDKDGIDENHEYLVLHFSNGTTAIFRNSHVNMFLIGHVFNIGRFEDGTNVQFKKF